MVDIAAKNPDKTRLIAMVWPMSKHPQNEIQRICLDRITGRGENHQSLRPVKTGEHEIILMRFFGQMDTFDPAFNPCDGPFDEIIEMDVAWSLEDSLDYVVENLVKIDTMEGTNANSGSEG
jgi:tRNA ligase